MDNMNGMKGFDSPNGNNNYEGMNISGISTETFGVQAGIGNDTQDGLGSYADSWTSGSYTMPGYDGVEPEPIKKEGRGLEIAALVFGILSLIICCCNGVFGLIGLVLSIVALAKGKRSGLSIAGLICSIIALLMALSVLLFSMTESGKMFWEAFEQGFNEGMEEQYDSQNDNTDYGMESDATETESDGVETEEYEESPVESNEGTVVISDEEAGKVVLDGNEFTIPCKLSDLLKHYSVNEFSQSELSGGLDSFETKMLFLGDSQLSISVTVSNYKDEKIEDINDGLVESISVDEGAGTIQIFNGINLDMSPAELEKALKDVKYNKSEMSGYTFYNIFIGDEQDYSVSVMLSEDKIENITVSHFDY